MIAHADVPKPPAIVRPHLKIHGRYVFVIKGSPWNGYVRVKVWCSRLSCGPETWEDTASGGFAS
jgi:hypothetical protein